VAARRRAASREAAPGRWAAAAVRLSSEILGQPVATAAVCLSSETLGRPAAAPCAGEGGRVVAARA
jgi:hypothetical protein